MVLQKDDKTIRRGWCLMKRYLKLILTMTKMKLSKDMIYSVDFWIAFVVDAGLFVFQIIAFTSIYNHIDTINGWTLNQMYIFIGTFSIVDSINMATFFFGIITLPNKVRTGQLDLSIVKPIDTQFYVSIQSFNPGSIFGVFVGGSMVTYGVINGGYDVTAIHVLGYILLVIMMVALMYALMLIIRACSFLFIKIDAIAQAEDSLVEFAFRVPGSAFRGVSKFIFMVLIPYGLIATVPTEHITNLLDYKEWLAVILITTVFVVLARVTFKFGMSKYTSASS